MPYDTELKNAEDVFEHVMGYPADHASNVEKITLRDVVKALRDNGLPQHTMAYYKLEYDNGIPTNTVVAACALGQIAINLRCNPYKLYSVLEQLWSDGNSPAVRSVEDAIVAANDKERKSFNEIADAIEKDYNLDDTLYIVKDDFWDNMVISTPNKSTV